mmetsp:Transcript_7770/g.25462  ORF Transcript_7770/g.25462 Transcript_7770/m.25462 type:complete len:400 (+) Transcript_7770:969-2168(+)
MLPHLVTASAALLTLPHTIPSRPAAPRPAFSLVMSAQGPLPPEGFHWADDTRRNRPLAVDFVADRAPGLALTGAIAWASEQSARRTAGLSPLLWASLGGIVVGSVLRAAQPSGRTLRSASAGMRFAKARLLRGGIVLYGAKLTMQKVLGIGAAGLLTDAYVLFSTLFLGLSLGRLLGLGDKLTTLISTGAAVCGCSAVAAAQPILDAEPHEVAAAVGTVVLCGTTSMFLYPFLFRAVPALAAAPRLMGIYTGATIHELAGVVAAGNAMSPDVASTAVVTKLLRVCLLEPWLLLLFYFGPASALRTSKTTSGPNIPWFALGFFAVAIYNSCVGFGASASRAAAVGSGACLAMAMAALGIDADLGKVRRLGLKPVLLAAILWANLLYGGLLAARFFMAVFP